MRFGYHGIISDRRFRTTHSVLAEDANVVTIISDRRFRTTHSNRRVFVAI